MAMLLVPSTNRESEGVQSPTWHILIIVTLNVTVVHLTLSALVSHFFRLTDLFLPYDGMTTYYMPNLICEFVLNYNITHLILSPRFKVALIILHGFESK